MKFEDLILCVFVDDSDQDVCYSLSDGDGNCFQLEEVPFDYVACLLDQVTLKLQREAKLIQFKKDLERVRK